jgi:ABC-type sugar transport system ATPase subunit
MASVTIRDVKKSYGDQQVMHGIDLDVNEGEFVVFVGPSGCGKSTLLRMIAGLEEISSGEILIGDKVVNNVAPAKRGVAMVFQSYALYPHMTVFNNMAFGLKQTKTAPDEIDRRVREAAEVLQITDYLDRSPRNLSGGQRQRVAIGRAIVRDPEVFLFDEPLSNLDAALRVQTRLEIARLHERLQSTMIYVTHDQVEAMTLADKIVVLRDGRIEQVGSPIDLYQRPANAFVAQFIGENNTLDGLVKEISNGMALVQLDDGKMINCNPVNVTKAGERTRVSIRPERVEFSKDRMEPGAHTLTAEVLEFIYMGDMFRTRLRVAGNDNFIVKTRNAPNQVQLEPGAHVEIGWLPSDCRALDA